MESNIKLFCGGNFSKQINSGNPNFSVILIKFCISRGSNFPRSKQNISLVMQNTKHNFHTNFCEKNNF